MGNFHRLTPTQKQTIQFIESMIEVHFSSSRGNPARDAEKFIANYLHEAVTMERVLER